MREENSGVWTAMVLPHIPSCHRAVVGRGNYLPTPLTSAWLAVAVADDRREWNVLLLQLPQ